MNNQFKNIWDNRLKRQDAHQTNAFNYNQLSNNHLNTFNNDNYNDHTNLKILPNHSSNWSLMSSSLSLLLELYQRK